jgi:hypothetical protein
MVIESKHRKGTKMEAITPKQDLLQLIHEHLNTAPQTTLEKVLELLEDEQDIRDARAAIADSRVNGTISWEEVKRDSGAMS